MFAVNKGQDKIDGITRALIRPVCLIPGSEFGAYLKQITIHSLFVFAFHVFLHFVFVFASTTK